MKQIALFLVPSAVALIAAGCSIVELETVKNEEPVKEEILIHKTFLAGTADTRTTLEGTKVLFAEGEGISIYDGSGNREFTANEAGSNVSFSGDVSATATEFYALSPYSASTIFTKNGSTVTAKTTLPAVQEATPGSFEDGVNISAAKASSSDSFSLENVLSIAKFTLSSANLGGHQIASVEITSTYPLAGDVVVTYGESCSTAGGTNTVNKVTLSHADGTVLADGTYYIAVLPNAGGEIALKFTDSEGCIATKTATLKSAFEAGSIKNLGTVKGLNWIAPYYEKVTSALTDWTGDYLIVYESDSQVLSGISSNLGSPSDVTINSEGTISWANYKAYNISIAKSGNGYSLNLNNSGYLGWLSGNSLTASDSDSAPSDYYRWSLSIGSNGDVLIKNLQESQRTIWYNSSYPRFCAYTSLGQTIKAVQLYKKKIDDSSPVIGPATVVLTTTEASSITNTRATLNATYSGLSPINVQEVGFYWGTDPSSITNVVYDNSLFSESSGSISASLTSLEANKTYYYKVTMQVWDKDTGEYKEFTGNVMSFTTEETYIPVVPQGWLELPAVTGSEDFVGTFFSSGSLAKNRNYSYYYDYSWYASMWVAYPLTSSHISGSNKSSWKFNPDIEDKYEVHIVDKSYQSNYGNGSYSRGHQIPNGDRQSNKTMNQQTYYATNQTPQLQNGFNGTIWASLEGAARTEASKSTVDTLYVATGPVYEKVGESGNITYLTATSSSVTPARLAVPNYYWKAFLKVKRRNDGTIESAMAIGFWFEHRVYKSSESYDQGEGDGKTPFMCSVDVIEQWTGLDLFANLPGDNSSGLEKQAESNASWIAFKNFL